MQYEEKFGVKVDVQIPEADRRRLHEQWERWIEGGVEDYLTLERPNLFTRYEHFVAGSGVGLPPDPFKPLCAQHRNADLRAIIEARKREYVPGEEYVGIIYHSYIPKFSEITGLSLDQLPQVKARRPDIREDCRIKIPEIVGVYLQGQRIDLDSRIIATLKLPTERDDLKLRSGTVLREVFDFDKGYRIELVKVLEERD